MSKDEMELEEAIKILKENKVMDINTINYDIDLNDYNQAIKIVLQKLELYETINKSIKEKMKELDWVEKSYCCQCDSCKDCRDEGRYFTYKEILERVETDNDYN